MKVNETGKAGKAIFPQNFPKFLGTAIFENNFEGCLLERKWKLHNLEAAVQRCS